MQITTRPDATVEADKPAKKSLASDEYRENFWRAMRAKSVPHEVYNALTIGTDSEGGYLVPDEYQRTLIDALQDAAEKGRRLCPRFQGYRATDAIAFCSGQLLQ